jgi:SSS family solute:Na+ symporter
MLGIAVTGLLAAFMAGVAANVTSFNTVVTYDLWQSYVRKDRDEAYYLRVGRIATAGGCSSPWPRRSSPRATTTS